MSPRYVGKICGQNNLLLFIPCHRVIRSDGKLGGFSAPGGINFKKSLPPLNPLPNLWTADTTAYYPEDRGISESVGFGRKLAKRVSKTLSKGNFTCSTKKI